MFVMTRLSIRSRTAMHSSAILSIMACARSASIAFSHRPSLYMQLYPCQAVKRHAPALVQAGIGVDAAHREVTGGEGLDGHLREVSVPDTAVFRTHLATFRSAAPAIGPGGGVPVGPLDAGIVEVPRPSRRGVADA